MSDPAAEKSVLERILEIGVYAPLGFLLTRAKAVPDLAEAGRKQVAFTRSLGRAALKGITRGMRAEPTSAAPPLTAPRPAPVEPEPVEPEPEVVVPEAEPVEREPEAVVPEAEPVEPEPEAVVPEPEPVEPEPEAVVPEPEPVEPEPVEPASAAPSGAIDGYASMTAKEIIALVASCSAEELQWIQRHETDHKARVTVLRAVEKANKALGAP